MKSYKYKLLKLNEIKTHSEQQVAQTYVDKFLVTDSQITDLTQLLQGACTESLDSQVQGATTQPPHP